MDGLTFIDHMTGHLAWAVALLGTVGILSLRHRRAIDDLIRRLRKAKAAGFEIELDEGHASADRAGLPPPQAILPRGTQSATWESLERRVDVEEDPSGELLRLTVLAVENPRRAVAETYQFVNRYASEASEYLDPEQTRYTDGSPDIMRTAAVTLLASEHADVLDHLRNAALRALDPDENVLPSQAIEYVLLATRLVTYMNGRIRALREARAEGGAEGPTRPEVPRGRRGTPPPA